MRPLAMLMATLFAGFSGTTGSTTWSGDAPDERDPRFETIAVVAVNIWSARYFPAGGPVAETFPFGRETDVKLLGDWDGNGVDTPGVVRGSTWYLNDELDEGYEVTAFVYGREGDTFVAGDWDGDGDDTPGVVRGNTWLLNNDLDGHHDVRPFTYGSEGDRPVVGDWNESGDDTPGVVRGNVWYLSNNFDGDHDVHPFAFGRATDKLLSGDWNGDGQDTPGVVRGNRWLLNDGFDGEHDRPPFTFGAASDTAVTHSAGALTAPPESDLRQEVVAMAESQVGNDCSVYLPEGCYPWCAVFAEWVWREVGVDPVFETDVATEVAIWAQEQGLWKPHTEGMRDGDPLPGDVVVYGQPDDGTGGHVAIVTYVHDDGLIDTVDGNYDDQVSSRTQLDPAIVTAGADNLPISGYVNVPGP